MAALMLQLQGWWLQGQADDFHETEHLLEARKMLYRQLANFGIWPEQPRG